MVYILLIAAVVIGLFLPMEDESQRVMKEYCDLECKSSKIKEYEFCC